MKSLIQQILEGVAERYPTPPEPATPAQPIYYCSNGCRTFVDSDSETCKQCQIDLARGYIARTMTGRCANGAERDSGTRVHAILIGESWKAVCSAQPGRRSVGWSEWGKDQPISCPRCVARLKRLAEQGKVTYE